MKRISKLRSILPALLAISSLIIVGVSINFWVSYGPVGQQQYYDQEYSEQKGYEIVGQADATNVVVLFPANGVDYSQYRKFASWLSNETSVSVLILKPVARAESFQVNISGYLSDFPQLKQLTFIGHSAGASSACKQSFLQNKPVKVVLVAGYCRDEKLKDVKSYVGVVDGFVPCSKAAKYQQVNCLDGVGHFVLTEKHFEETENSGILELLKKDILENLQL